MGTLANVFWVFIGGGMGSLCRYAIAQMLVGFRLHFPLATFFANVISCFILGVLLSFSFDEKISDTARLLWMTGFCGGFSTFSTFTGETYLLMQQNAWFHAILNITGSLLVCLISLYLGMKAGR